MGAAWTREGRVCTASCASGTKGLPSDNRMSVTGLKTESQLMSIPSRFICAGTDSAKLVRLAFATKGDITLLAVLPRPVDRLSDGTRKLRCQPLLPDALAARSCI